jgi:hypothetical protein
MTINLTLSFVLAAVALVCGLLMLVGGRVGGRAPYAAIAIICLAINQLGIVR